MALLETTARAPYDEIASGYDQLTEGYDYAGWLRNIEHLALETGLRGRRVLDVGCGTGSSFLPLLDAGYEVVACDISAEMVLRAQRRAGIDAEVLVADMRELPRLGEFDLITCLDDTINHLDEEADVVRSFAGMARNLAPRGLVVFDVNTFSAYRRASDHVSLTDDRLLAWRGEPAVLAAPGEVAEVAIEIFERTAGDCWSHRSFRQRHRHYPVDQIAALLEPAGLRVLARRGQRSGGVLEPELDEATHTKALFVATHGTRTAQWREWR